MSLVALYYVLQVFMLSVGALAAAEDKRSFRLPNCLTLLIFVSGICTQIVLPRVDVLKFSVVLIGLHFAISLIRPKAFGMGDVKFMTGIAISIPSSENILIWVYLAYLFGLFHGILNKISRKSSRIPFGLSLYGAWLLICVGEWGSVALVNGR